MHVIELVVISLDCIVLVQILTADFAGIDRFLNSSSLDFDYID